uniref:Glucosamine-phosphate N-acetyltransferase n=1 Tax=Magallana gigas TaxID=29159 RepID=A0A8W8NB27_MAGGI
MEDDDFIYPPDLLGSIDFEKEHIATYDPQLSLPNPGPNLVVRPLRRSDYDKGYMDLLLSALYVRDQGITQQEFEDRFDRMKASGGSYIITVIEDTSTKKIVGNAVLHVELKFLQPSVKMKERPFRRHRSFRKIQRTAARKTFDGCDDHSV